MTNSLQSLSYSTTPCSMSSSISSTPVRAPVDCVVTGREWESETDKVGALLDTDAVGTTVTGDDATTAEDAVDATTDSGGNATTGTVAESTTATGDVVTTATGDVVTTATGDVVTTATDDDVEVTSSGGHTVSGGVVVTAVWSVKVEPLTAVLRSGCSDKTEGRAN